MAYTFIWTGTVAEGRDEMSDCTKCKYAIWDYEEYYGTNKREYFVSDCARGYDPGVDDCGDEYEERQDE